MARDAWYRSSLFKQQQLQNFLNVPPSSTTKGHLCLQSAKTIASILIFLPILIQLAIAGPVERATKQQQDYPSTGCFALEGNIPDRGYCHRVIDAFSQSSKTGLTDLAPGSCIGASVSTCGGFICNYNDHQVQINMAKMAIDMTVNVYDRCVLNDRYGQYVSEGVEAGLAPTPYDPQPPTRPMITVMTVEEVKEMVGGAMAPEVDGSISGH
ncbi:hypothetical protein QBC40DRAFT_256811 [Triangularia verruculosa]|uniref:Uncharacterized protein n=1 Tax=Triangularia verruculosa TaxID=2587418 RepID=A0AAN7ASH6_9PEZI|nr:hypothetical protein QBC40DRAFT_256811 [Triangularia verruculosa]